MSEDEHHLFSSGEYDRFDAAIVEKLLEIRDNPTIYIPNFENGPDVRCIGITVHLVAKTEYMMVGYQIRVVTETEDGIFEHLKTRDSLSTWEWDGASEIITWEMLENI